MGGDKTTGLTITTLTTLFKNVGLGGMRGELYRKARLSGKERKVEDERVVRPSRKHRTGGYFEGFPKKGGGGRKSARRFAIGHT